MHISAAEDDHRHDAGSIGDDGDGDEEKHHQVTVAGSARNTSSDQFSDSNQVSSAPANDTNSGCCGGSEAGENTTSEEPPATADGVAADHAEVSAQGSSSDAALCCVKTYSVSIHTRSAMYQTLHGWSCSESYAAPHEAPPR